MIVSIVIKFGKCSNKSRHEYMKFKPISSDEK
jgi:hypothetical protein